jgi:Alternative oxidase
MLVVASRLIVGTEDLFWGTRVLGSDKYKYAQEGCLFLYSLGPFGEKTQSNRFTIVSSLFFAIMATTVILQTRAGFYKVSALSATRLLNATTCRPLSTCNSSRQNTSSFQTRSFRRGFTSDSVLRLKEVFPVEDTPQIRKTESAWQHPMYGDKAYHSPEIKITNVESRYSKQQLESVQVAHRKPRTTSDRVAFFFVRVLRWGMDKATGYKHFEAVQLAKTDAALAEQKFGMDERKYMIRNIFLESVAGVPGMVAGMLRHLRSMRLMRRDNGWMETLLEES